MGESEMAKAPDNPSKLARMKEELADVIICCLSMEEPRILPRTLTGS